MVQSHYFTDNRGLHSDRKNIEFRLLENTFTFVTDDGVFSKGGVDTGTALLLKNAVSLRLSGDVLDLGCGYGPVGVVIKTLFPDCRITCSDVNPRALELTQLNAEKNHAALETVLSDCYSGLDGTWDAILTNPPIRAGKDVVHEMLAGAYDRLNPGGILMAVIRRKQGAESAVKKITEVFGACEVTDRDKGYWILKGTKR